MERSNSRENPLHAQAQLRGQLQHIATHFLSQHRKYASNTQLIHRTWPTVLRSQADLFASFQCACNHMSTVKTNRLSQSCQRKGCMFETGPWTHSAFRPSQIPESAANQLKGCRSNQMHGETKPASAVRLFTSQFNSAKCAAADILRALCTAAGRIQLKTETRNCSRDLGSCSRCLRSLEDCKRRPHPSKRVCTRALIYR